MEILEISFERISLNFSGNDAIVAIGGDELPQGYVSNCPSGLYVRHTIKATIEVSVVINNDTIPDEFIASGKAEALKSDFASNRIFVFGAYLNKYVVWKQDAPFPDYAKTEAAVVAAWKAAGCPRVWNLS